MPVPTLVFRAAYRPLFELHDLFTVIEGPRGTAKTRSILTYLLLVANQFPGTRVVLFRATRTSLTQTVLNTLENQVFPAFGLSVPGGASKENRSGYTLANGSEIVPLGLDDPQQRQRLFSSEWTLGYGAEANELSQDQVESGVAPTIRHYPVDQHGQQCPAKIILDHNPVAPGHWIYQRTEAVDPSIRRAVMGVVTKEQYEAMKAHNRRPAADPKRHWKRVVTKHMDNPGYWDLAAWDWTAAGKRYLNTLDASLTGFQRRRMLDGEPCAAEGTVFPEFVDSTHTIPPFDLPDSWPIFQYVDPGYDHPCAVLWIAVGLEGQAYVVDEVYRSGWSIQQHASEIKRREALHGWSISGRYLDPMHGFSHTAQSPRTIAEQFRIEGLSFTAWPRPGLNKDGMVNDLRRRLVNRTEGGKPMLRAFNCCPSTIMEFQSWAFKRSSSGDLPAGDDKYEDRNNHAMDCLCAFASMNPRGQPSKAIVHNG